MPDREERVKVGDVAPAASVELQDQNGEPVRLSQLKGQNLVVYFYPADNTPGCTVEGREFRDLYDQFRAFDCEVLGVSPDSVASHREFAQNNRFPFRLLSDPTGEFAKAFGVWNERGRVSRTTFVLDRDLRVRRIFREVDPRGHAQQVLDFVRSIIESHRMLGG